MAVSSFIMQIGFVVEIYETLKIQSQQSDK